MSDNGASVMFANGDVSQLACLLGRMSSLNDWETMSRKALDFSHHFDIDETCSKWNGIFVAE